MTICNKPDFYTLVTTWWNVIDKLQHAGKIDKLQPVFDVFCCVLQHNTIVGIEMELWYRND